MCMPGVPAATEEALEAGELQQLVEDPDASGPGSPPRSVADDYPSTLEDEAITLPHGSRPITSPWPTGTLMMALARMLVGVALLYGLALWLGGQGGMPRTAQSIEYVEDQPPVNVASASRISVPGDRSTLDAVGRAAP